MEFKLTVNNKFSQAWDNYGSKIILEPCMKNSRDKMIEKGMKQMNKDWMNLVWTYEFKRTA